MRFKDIRQLQKDLMEIYAPKGKHKKLDITAEVPEAKASGSRFNLEELEAMQNKEVQKQLALLRRQINGNSH